MKNIVFITTGQPSTNPRIIKEAESLQKAGFEITILYCFFIQWAISKDTEILKDVPWKCIMIGGSPEDNKLAYVFTRVRYKLMTYLHRFFGNRFLLAERTQARAYDELLHAAKNIKADWYIGHNLGALAVTVKAARFNNAKAGFDFEDYHRGEYGPAETDILKRIIYLENKYIPLLNYYSTASAMITDCTKKNHTEFTNAVITLLNCFPLKQQPVFKEKKDNDGSLHLFWFSQTIGLNRGLEMLITVLKSMDDVAIHLTLAGRCNEDMQLFIKNNAGRMISNIHFAGIVSPEELPEFASRFDVGMALELTTPHNRDICLTNKVFTYLLAGNAVILSETSMQTAFNQLYKIGETFPEGDENALAEKIKVFKDLKKLNTQKSYNYNLSKSQLNWDFESEKLLAIIN